MALKLLNPTAAAADKKNRKEADSARVVEIQELIAQKHRELADAEAAFDDNLKWQREQWDGEEHAHQNHIAELSKKVEGLEERRKAALVPLKVRAQELDTIASALTLREKKVAEGERKNDEISKFLEQRLDEVGERDRRLGEREQQLVVKEQGAHAQAQEVRKGSEALSKAIVEAQRASVSREKSLDRREMALNGRESSIEERERRNAVKEEELVTREVKLADDRALLERNMQRIEQNGKRN